MGGRLFPALMAAAGIAALGAGSAAHAQGGATGTRERDAASEDSLPDIVVTAQKREQRLQDVPVSVTALDPQTMIANRVVNIADLNALVPNLTVREATAGIGLPSISMRGMLSLGVIPGADRQVGLYLDGVYINSPAGSIFDVADIQRIEVLRGPQGTLFGRNSTAGAISLITPDPAGKFALHQELSVGNLDQLRSRTRLNLPALGPLSASVSYLHSQRRGDVRNLGGGTVWDFRAAPQNAFGVETSPKWLGSENIESLLAAVKFESGAFRATYKFDWTENRYTPTAVGVIALNPAGAGPVAGPLLAALLATQPPTAQLTPITKRRPDAVNNAFTVPAFNRNYGHNLTARYRFSDSLSVQNILAYRSTYARAASELSGYGGLVNTIPPSPAFPVPLGTPFLIFSGITESRAKQWSDEAQLNYASDFATVTAGYLHFHGKVEQGGPTGFPNAATFKFYPNFVVTPTSDRPSVATTDSDAAYAQAEVHVMPRLDLLAGYRHTWDDKDAVAYVTGVAIASAYRDDNPSWTLGVDYKPWAGMLAYAKYSAAFVAGGSFSGVEYAPEHAKSWEAGLKAEWLDRRLRTNLSLFTVKYSGLQQTVAGFNYAVASGRPELARVPVLLVNSGSARATGFEFEAFAVPTGGLTLQTGIGYTHSKFLSVDPLFGKIDTVNLIFRPKWTANLAAQYETPPLWNEARLLARIDGNYRSSYDLSIGDPTPALAALAHSQPTWIANGRLALTGLSIGGSRGELALWGRNLFDSRSISFAAALAFDYTAIYERARTYGLELTIDF